MRLAGHSVRPKEYGEEENVVLYNMNKHVNEESEKDQAWCQIRALNKK